MEKRRPIHLISTTSKPSAAHGDIAAHSAGSRRPRRGRRTSAAFLPAVMMLTLCGLAAGCRQAGAPQPYGAVPTPQQVTWQRMETNMFCHFGPNTFSGVEWGDGQEPEDLFNPSALDCRQWVSTARQAGMRGIIVTAKHHDGFCLWPNPASRHTVRQSRWQEGQGDVLRALSTACREGGLRFGVYVSPWDRNAPTYGTPEYNRTYLQTLRSVLSDYGPIFELWFDGANGEGPDGKKQTYDWPAFNAQALALQPQAILFSDCGPGCRWTGNEEGHAGETCWSTLNIEGCTPSGPKPAPDTLNTGHLRGSRWVPAETDVSIRKGWFYRDEEQPKSLQELLKIYYTSVGRNSLLLLNVPPDRRGRICAADSTRLLEWRRALDSIFATDLAQGSKIKASSTRGRAYRPANLLDTAYHTYWAASDGISGAQIALTFPQPRTFNRVMLQEYIPLGQRVQRFHMEYRDRKGKWQLLDSATTIGYKRILPCPTATASALRIVIDQSLACPVLNRVALFYDKIYKDE